MTVEIDGFRVQYMPQETRPVHVGGTIGIIIKQGSIEGAVRFAQELRPRLREVGIELEEECSRRGNGGGSWGTMEYDFAATRERTALGFSSPEDAVMFINRIVAVLGCEPLTKRGSLHITRSYDVLAVVDGKRRWVHEERELIERAERKGRIQMERTGKYLTFFAAEDFGVKALNVREIMGFQQDIRPLSGLSDCINWVKGVFNLRGKAVVVVDFRLKLRLSEAEPTPQTCIIVVQLNRNPRTLVGIIVDSVREVINIITENDVESAGEFAPTGVVGATTVRGRRYNLLDLDVLFGDGAMFASAE